MTEGEVRPVIKQASDDLEKGMVDTDMRATPGQDAQQRERYVAGAGGRPFENDVGSKHGTQAKSPRPRQRKK